MLSVRFVVLSLAFAAVPSCAANVTGPDRPGPVRLTAHINRIQIAPLATATATFRRVRFLVFVFCCCLAFATRMLLVEVSK